MAKDEKKPPEETTDDLLRQLCSEMKMLRTSVEEGSRRLDATEEKQQQLESRLEATGASALPTSSASTVHGTPQERAESSNINTERTLEMLYSRLTEFNFNPENGDIFDAWYTRYKDLIEIDARDVNDDTKARLIVSKLATPMHQQYLKYILPKEPKDFNLQDTVKKLTHLFGKKKSIFRSRYECLQLSKSPLDNYLQYAASVNASCEDFGISVITADEFKNLIFLCGLKSPEEETLRSRILHMMDTKPTATLDDLVAEIQRMEELQKNSRLIGDQQLVNNSINRIHQHKNQKSSRFTSKDEQNCKYCGGSRHSQKYCPARNASCRYCQKNGHYAQVCMKKKSDEKKTHRNKQVDSITAPLRNGRRQVELFINGRTVRLLLDTGSDITLVSEATWKMLGRPTLSSLRIAATAANGKPLTLHGKFECEATFQDERLCGSVFVTDSLNLLGIDWMERLPTFRSLLDAVCNRVSIKSSNINTSSPAAVHRDSTTHIEDLKRQYADVFSSTLGLCKHAKARLQLKKDATAVFRPSRPVPYAARENVEQELDRLEKLGVITKVETSTFAAPMVIVKKKDGKLRVCSDFSTGLNDSLEDVSHPLPTADAIFASLNGGTIFSTIDFKDAYLQVELEDDSKSLLVINTHRGLYRYNRLPFGVKTAPAIFQRIMDMMLAGLPGCCAYLDDVIVSGRNAQEHNDNLEACLKRISKFGFHVNFEKCTFAQTQIRYLGMIITKEGRTPDSAKITAIQEMPAPQDVSQLRSFIGCINYYGSFLKNLHDLRAPLDRLLRTDVKWEWTTPCQAAFENIKKKLLSPLLLTHYDPEKELLVVTDASQHGIGAVLLHRFKDGTQRAVEHASRTLTPAERNYGQIEKEGLAIYYGLKKFYNYIMGRKFLIVTDHKPLISIFGSKKGIPIVTANRLQRWATYMLGFDFNIQFKPTTEVGCADVLSRLIPQNRTPTEDTVIATINMDAGIYADHLRSIAALPVTATMIQTATAEDATLQAALAAHRSGNWPRTPNKDLQELFNRRSAISETDGILLFSDRIIVPSTLKGKVLKQLHSGHQGMVRTKHLARTLVYWPGIDADIEHLVRSCGNCQRASKMPVKTTMESWSKPEKPWTRLHCDFAGPLDGRYYMVLVDSYSKWPEIVTMDRITTSATITQLNRIFAQFGMPETLVSDNGTQFTSAEFGLYCKRNGITHIFSPPYHPQSNGQAERFVDTFKRALLKLKGEGTPAENLQTFLLSYRQTPAASVPGNVSPAEAFLGRCLRTSLDLMKPKPARLANKDIKMEQQFNKKHGSRTRIYFPGDLVFALDYKNPAKPAWIEATVTTRHGAVLYDLEVAGRHRLLRRHANQMRPRTSAIRPTATDILMDTFLLEQPLPPKTTHEALNTTRTAIAGSPNNIDINADTEDNEVIPALDAAVDPDEDGRALRRSTRRRQPPAKLDMDPRKKRY